MSIFLKTDANVKTPSSSMPYLEKDYAIVRGVTRAMFDFSNSDCYSGSGNLIGGSTIFKDLTINNSVARVLSDAKHVFAPIENGMIKILGGSTANGRFVSLGTQFKLPATTRKALIIIHAKIPKSGWSANHMGGIVGAGLSNTDFQYFAFVSSDDAGNLASIRFRIKGASGNIDATVQGSALNKVTGLTVQQLGLTINIVNSVATIEVLIDGEVVVTGSGSATQLNQYDSSSGNEWLQAIFVAPSVGFLSVNTNDVRLGRVSCHDLTNRPDITFANILLKDRQSAAGYIS